ncbi:hypothetical protein PTKU46_58270 [Paraburkholderia terrae]
MPGGLAIFWFHRIHEADDVLLRLCCLTLRGLLLSELLRKVSADHAATDRTNDSVVPRVVPSDPAYHRAFEAAWGVCRVCRCEDQRRCNQGDSCGASAHGNSARVAIVQDDRLNCTL